MQPAGFHPGTCNAPTTAATTTTGGPLAPSLSRPAPSVATVTQQGPPAAQARVSRTGSTGRCWVWPVQVSAVPFHTGPDGPRGSRPVSRASAGGKIVPFRDRSSALRVALAMQDADSGGGGGPCTALGPFFGPQARPPRLSSEEGGETGCPGCAFVSVSPGCNYRVYNAVPTPRHNRSRDMASGTVLAPMHEAM